MFSSSNNDKEKCVEAINLRVQKLNGFKLITAFSKEHGLLKLCGSKLGGRSEPFVHNLYWISNSKSDIFSIRHTEFKGQFKELLTDLDRLTWAWQFAEFIETGSHYNEDKSREIFDLFLGSLEQLSKSKKDEINFICSSFLWNLSAMLGYKVSLGLCDRERSDCKLYKESENTEAWFDLEQGGIMCSACQERTSRNKVKILPNIYRTLIGLENNRKVSEHNQQAEEFITSLLQKHLQEHTNKRLKSNNIAKCLRENK